MARRLVPLVLLQLDNLRIGDKGVDGCRTAFGVEHRHQLVVDGV